MSTYSLFAIRCKCHFCCITVFVILIFLSPNHQAKTTKCKKSPKGLAPDAYFMFCTITKIIQ